MCLSLIIAAAQNVLEPTVHASKLRIKEMGSRYLFIILALNEAPC
jgi:hypothetical protein